MVSVVSIITLAANMKRRDLIRHLERNDCEFLREGGSHTVYVNRKTQKVSTVPRHNEINTFLARKICHDLQITTPRGKK